MMQRLEWEILIVSRRHDYRLCQRTLYEPIYVGSTHTLAYRDFTTLEAFVRNFMRRKNEAGDATAVQEGLCLRLETSMRKLVKTQTQWSFRNGIYTADDDMFWPYDEACANDEEGGGKVGPFRDALIDNDAGNLRLLSFISAKFINAVFPDFPSNDVPGMDDVFSAQNWTRETRAWAWALIGRMFYPPEKRRDNWQVAAVMAIGNAGARSFIQELVTGLYDDENVCILPPGDNNTTMVPDTTAFMACSFSSAQPPPMHHRALAVLAVPSVPDWTRGDEWADRIVPFLFDKDDNAFAKHRVSTRYWPAIIVKANQTYREFAQRYKEDGIDGSGSKVWSEQMQAWKRQFDECHL